MKALTRFAFVALGLSAFSTGDAQGGRTSAATFDVFYVAVGSEDYAVISASDSAHGVNGFHSLRSPRASAKRVDSLFQANGAAFGVTITSDARHFVSRRDVFGGLSEVLTAARAARGGHPLVVFYFAGHGVSEGVAWSLFPIPGDFTFTGNLSLADADRLSEHAIYAGYVIDSLEASKIPFMAMFDNCQSGADRRFQSPTLAPEAQRNLGDMQSVLRNLNEFRGANPVLFAAPPGDSVFESFDPFDATFNLAPLARRMTLAYSFATKRHVTLSLRTFIEWMTSPTLDRETRVATTKSGPPRDGLLTSLSPATARRYIARVGSASAASPPFRPKGEVMIRMSEDGTITRAGSNGDVKWDLRSAHFLLTRQTGDFISDGEPADFIAEAGDAQAVQHGDGDVAITLNKGGANWEIDLAMPSRKRFERGHFAGAERYDFQAPSKPGLSISHSGRGCNTVSGDFDVVDVAYDSSGRLIRLTVRFTQRCDGGPPLTGELMLGKTSK